MLSGFQNIPKIPELKRRIGFSLLMLAVYRIGVHVPTPGIDAKALAALFQDQASRGTLLAMFDMFAGGAFSNLSVFALGIMPYISASIIIQLLTVVIPYLERLSKEGEAGRKQITKYTRIGTVILSAIQGLGIAFGLERMAPTGAPIVIDPGWAFRIMTVITLTAGTAFIMWIGEQITQRGIGNGISLIIFAGIVARLPNAIGLVVAQVSEGVISFFLMLFILVFMVLVIGGIIFMERGQRRVPVQYPKRVVGRKMYGGQSTYLPLRINMAGVIPPIFASSLMMFPATIEQFVGAEWLQSFMMLLTPGEFLYEFLYVILIVFFCYFYTAVTFNPVDVASNMKKGGGYIPGIRPGKRTAEYIERILTRLTFGGALYVSAVCVLPSILINSLNMPFYFGGTALLIVVGVALDTVAQMESHLITRHYDGFMGAGKRFKGRR
ncbi:MAG TPA: preprotein translocase subunit SecY [Thermodesulfobacteriota bacterium]|nr:preprotein translocase subunit SecY [Deltaproteobacteria bacterium]HNR14793.1 preprotein translocase subunit SecY [Thermodesulfobacteriota bacterium]